VAGGAAYAAHVASAASTASPGVVVPTKLNPPVVGELVDRPRLLDTLTDSSARLALIRAPAGWGKTTLVAAWSSAAQEERRFAWVSLDSDDGDPSRFWLYVIRALHDVDPAIGAASLPLLAAPGTEIESDVLPSLLAELLELDGRVVLVLDDYHRIRDPSIHEQLTFLIDHLPENLSVAITTRVEPPLPVARLRAAGNLVELDTGSLGFDSGESGLLLNGLLDLRLDQAEIDKLRLRTEGWPAGLYLAALSLRGTENPGRFVEEFAGDDRNVVDYLGAEVLAAQRPELREALLRTSILDRFNAALVEAVADVDDGAALLQEIERDNLFLIPLDTKRRWYRYHHLFQELLRLELSLAEPDLEPELHRRAAASYLEAGMTDEGIRHTIAAGEGAAATELIAQNWALTLLAEAGDATIDRWLKLLGEDAVAADFRLCFARCYVELSLGRMEEVARWLAMAEDAPIPGPSYEGLSSKAGGLACVRCAYLWELGDVGGALPPAHEVLEEEGEDSPWRAIGAAVIGLCAGARGDWAEGSKWCREYSRLGAKFGQHLNESSGAGSAAGYEAEAGNWDEAERLARHSLEISSRYGMDEHWMTSEAHLALGLLHIHRGELEQAQPELARAAEVGGRGAGPVITAHALLHLTLVRTALGDREGARAALDEGEGLVASAPDAGPLLPRRLSEARGKLTAPARKIAPGDELSERELDVLRLLATEMTQREIGERLYVSLNTVKSHSRAIFRKLGASGRPEAVARARELGLL
jgi:LuxR family transcriptional regulator, maltose regulon positive regulatory protein